MQKIKLLAALSGGHSQSNSQFGYLERIGQGQSIPILKRDNTHTASAAESCIEQYAPREPHQQAKKIQKK